MKRPSGFDPTPEKAPKKKSALITPLRSKQKLEDESTNSSIPRPAIPNEPLKEQRILEKERRRVEKSEYRKFTRDRQRRRRNFFVVVSVVLVFVIALSIAVFSPLFAIRKIEIIGTERIDSADIDAALASEYGLPLPLLNQSEVSEKLAQFTLIESYAIESHLPDTLVLRIVERTPLLIQQTAEGFVLFDAAGVVMAVSPERQSGFPLLQADAIGAEASGFMPAVSVLRALPPSLLAEVDSIVATTKDDVSFWLNDSEKQVIWGDSSQTSLKVTLLAQLLKNIPQGKVYDVSSTTSPSVR
ncbi:MAG: FtsQ-type POTRA domain-containing protein [Microbacteriaceae bacterium]